MVDDMEISQIVAIASVVVAFFSFLWAVYSHLSNRRTAKLLYEVSQLSDASVPSEVFSGISEAPVLVELQSIGNKQIENIKLSIVTKSAITRVEGLPSDNLEYQDNSTLRLSKGDMNPTETLKFILFCRGDPSQDQIKEIAATHAEGIGQNIKSKDLSLSVNFPGFSLEYIVATGALRLARLGPFFFR